MDKFLNILRNEWPRYLIEIVVIILGISLSFWLSEWRSSSANQSQEKHLLESIHSDLVADSTALVSDIHALKRALNGFQKLLNYQKESNIPADSINIYIVMTMRYVFFPGSDNGYEEMKQTGTSNLISNRELLSKIIENYNMRYPGIKEWNTIDRQYVLERMIPYMDEHAPHVSGGFGGVTANNEKIIDVLFRKDMFRNMVRTNSRLKTAILSIYETELANIRQLVRHIELEIEGLN